MKTLTAAERRRLVRLAQQVRTLADKMTDIILEDDPLFGDAWSALNRIAADAAELETTFAREGT